MRSIVSRLSRPPPGQHSSTTEELVRRALDAAGFEELAPATLRRASPRSVLLSRPRAAVARALKAAGFTSRQIGEAIGLSAKDAIRFAVARRGGYAPRTSRRHK